jgi:hypothetical protein
MIVGLLLLKLANDSTDFMWIKRLQETGYAVDDFTPAFLAVREEPVATREMEGGACVALDPAKADKLDEEGYRAVATLDDQCNLNFFDWVPWEIQKAVSGLVRKCRG